MVYKVHQWGQWGHVCPDGCCFAGSDPDIPRRGDVYARPMYQVIAISDTWGTTAADWSARERPVPDELWIEELDGKNPNDEEW